MSINRSCLAAGLVSEFFKFCLVGTVGFVADAGRRIYFQIRRMMVGESFTNIKFQKFNDPICGMNPYVSRLFSYLFAATITWWLNRRFTFAACTAAGWQAQWLRYLVVNAVGGGVNYGVYALAVFLSVFVRDHLYLGVAAGSAVGLAVNFTASRFLVFKNR